MSDNTSKQNNALIITLVILTIIIVGVGAYFVGHFFSKEKAPIISAPTDTASTSPNTSGNTANVSSENAEATLKTKSLENLFGYPHNLSFESGNNLSDESSKIMMLMETLDGVDVIYDYYNSLASVNNWNLGSQGLASDNSGSWINIEEKDFRAEIKTENNGNKRLIRITISYDSENMTFSQNKPQKTSTDTSSTPPTNTTPVENWDWWDQIEGWEYIIDDSHIRIISEAELRGLTPWQLKVARNEIYARHGRGFVHKDLQCYFDQQSWYQINPSFKNSDLSSLENKNVATILNYETKISSPYLRHDSGCH
ncbi:MAG: YARHG domain-containing protein [Patescibacteria group bacterium]|nr:YARHG domain-containing protein [Patescibacteria group bacterium]